MTIIWHPVITFPLDVNLLPLLRILEHRGTVSRVTEENGRQQLWISEQHRVMEVAELSGKWSAGELDLSVADAQPAEQSFRQSRYFSDFQRLLHWFPVSLSVIFLGGLGTLLVALDTATLRYAQLFLFQPRSYGVFLPWSVVPENHQYWRLLTPVFLHFSLFHILFNSIVLWAMGTRIERVKGSSHYLLLIIMTGVVANMTQYLSQPNTVFGGLSGVAYGVIGYIAVYQTFVAHPLLQFNRAAIAFFIVWMLLGYTGVVDFFIVGSVANNAHLAGLVTGGFFGAVIVWLDTKRQKRW